MTSLPAEVTYGRVIGSFIKAVADGFDADAYPDRAPVVGQVIFTPISYLKLDGATPPATVVPLPITVPLTPDGLVDVELIATDCPAANPTGWTWRVSFLLAGGISLPSFSFALPGGTTVDLTLAAPIAAASGSPVTRGLPGPAVTAVTLDGSHHLVFSMADSSSVTGPDIVAALAGVFVAQPTSGTPSSATYLRGDGTWSTPAGGGGLTATDNGDGTIALAGPVTDNGDGTISIAA